MQNTFASLNTAGFIDMGLIFHMLPFFYKLHNYHWFFFFFKLALISTYIMTIAADWATTKSGGKPSKKSGGHYSNILMSMVLEWDLYPHSLGSIVYVSFIYFI